MIDKLVDADMTTQPGVVGGKGKSKAIVTNMGHESDVEDVNEECSANEEEYVNEDDDDDDLFNQGPEVASKLLIKEVRLLG